MRLLLQLFLLFLFGSCANIVSPTGGDKDVLPPEILNITNQQENGQVKAIYFEFNELIVLNNWENNFYISPPIKKLIQKSVKGEVLKLVIEDPLAENTTYNLSLRNCVKDLNEGNVLDSLNYIFSTSEKIDSLGLSGKLQDSYTLEAIENAWIMLFEKERHDTVIFNEIPNYVTKTNQDGAFNFPNLKANDYKIAALTDVDLIYNKGEKIAFLNTLINTELDSLILLFAFNPIIEIDSAINDTLDLNNILSAKTQEKKEIIFGDLQIITPLNLPAVFQLLQNKKIINEFVFDGPPYSLKKIIPGKYQLKYVHDANENGKWDSGDWDDKTQPEKVVNYPSEITIRSNWNLELEWKLK